MNRRKGVAQWRQLKPSSSHSTRWGRAAKWQDSGHVRAHRSPLRGERGGKPRAEEGWPGKPQSLGLLGAIRREPTTIALTSK
eukprot:443019-Pyramimonas_sp.AAC.1